MWLSIVTVVIGHVFYVKGNVDTVYLDEIQTGSYESWKRSALKVNLVIVGGGVAGLTAAKTLVENGFQDFVLLEADDRLGGRVRTRREDNFVTEEGAEWIHGGPRNPLYQLAKNLDQLSTNLPDSSWDFRVKNNQGNSEDPTAYYVIDEMEELLIDKETTKKYQNRSAHQFLEDKFPEIYGQGWNDDLGKAWFHTLQNYLLGSWGTRNLSQVSLLGISQFQENGEDHQWKNGYDTLIKHLTKSIPPNLLRVSSPVSKIFWKEKNQEEEGVLVVAKNGQTSFFAKQIIVTTSVGYLQERHEHLFQPSLPQEFIRNIGAVRLGVSDKIQMGWSEPWWGSKAPLMIVLLWKDYSLPQEMDWMYGIFAVLSVHRFPNMLEAFIVGEDAVRMENLPEETVKSHFQQLLGMYTGLQVPEPTFFKRTQWGLDPWRKGSYSTVITMEGERAGLTSHKQLAEPLINSKGSAVVFWAGEHTHETRYSTVDGAMATGEREAKRVLSHMGLNSRATSGSHTKTDTILQIGTVCVILLLLVIPNVGSLTN